MTEMTRFSVVDATVMGLLISISLVPINAYGKENEVNLTEFRISSGKFQRTFDAKAIFLRVDPIMTVWANNILRHVI